MTKLELSASSMISLAEDQVSCDLNGEEVILQLKSGTYYGLQSVGCRIWQLLEKPRSFAEICEALMEEYDVSAGQCKHEVAAFFEELAAAGLVRISPESSAELLAVER